MGFMVSVYRVVTSFMVTIGVFVALMFLGYFFDIIGDFTGFLSWPGFLIAWLFLMSNTPDSPWMEKRARVSIVGRVGQNSAPSHGHGSSAASAHASHDGHGAHDAADSLAHSAKHGEGHGHH